MKVSKTKLKGVLKIQLDPFRDHRGAYLEIYDDALYRKLGISVKFVQDDYSRSFKRVLRGFHGDNKTWKLITCPFGRIYLVVVNADRKSKDFGKWESFVLSDEDHIQILVPPKHGLAHLVLSDEAIFHYKQSTHYDPKNQFTYRWDDKRFCVRWPVKNPILSRRDAVFEINSDRKLARH